MKSILNRIQMLPPNSIIMISGFGGAGKSTLANDIAEHIDCQIISFDEFYRDMTDYHEWGCYDYDRLIETVLVPYKHGVETTYQAHNWIDPTETITNLLFQKPYLIIEGVGLFHPTILSFVDLSIWVDCPIEEAIQQGKRRDKEEYGVNHDSLWDTIWKQNDIECFIKYDPLKVADIVYQVPIKS